MRSCRKDVKWLSRIAFHCVVANNFRFNMQMSAKEKYLAWQRLIYSIIGSRVKIKTTTEKRICSEDPSACKRLVLRRVSRVLKNVMSCFPLKLGWQSWMENPESHSLTPAKLSTFQLRLKHLQSSAFSQQRCDTHSSWEERAFGYQLRH